MVGHWENFDAVPRSAKGKHVLDFDPAFPLQIRAICLGVSDRLTPHYHDYLEVALVGGGRGACEIGSVDSPFAAGDLAVINSTDLHTFWSDPEKPVRLLVVYFLPELLVPPEGGGAGREYLSVFFDRGPEFEPHLERSLLAGSAIPSIVRSMARSASEPLGPDPALRGLRLRTDLYRLLLGLREFYARDIDSRMAEARMSRLGRLTPIFDLVHESYAEPISLDMAARAAGLSSFRFCRVFKEATGKTFVGYLQRVRIDRARELLADTDCPVSYAAAESGFENASFFSKVFRSFVGMSPSEYRRTSVPSSERR